MTETELGLDLIFGEYQVFFGNRDASLVNLQKTFPDLHFLRAQQVHGNVIHEVDLQTPDYSLKGDGLLTEARNLALCSISADCVPVLVAATGTPWIGAFHAGWRGVAARIIPMGLQKLIYKGAAPEKIRVWIGPHILQPSFEVHADVRDQILQSRPPMNALGPVENWAQGLLDYDATVCYAQRNKEIFNINLVSVLLEQMAALDIPLENVEMHLCDTKTDSRFHSARRDKELSGRQISWIARRIL